MRASERLTVLVLLVLSAVTVAARPPGGALTLAVFLGMAATTVLLARAGAGSRPLAFLRDWWGLAVVAAIFMLLQPVIEAAAPWRLDAALAAFDARYLAWLKAIWRPPARSDTFTDLVYAGYLSYYFLPVVVAAAAWWRHRPEVFERVAFALLLTFYLCYLCYLVMPASGPRLPLEEEALVVGGGAFSDAARAFLRAAEATTLDAFPSGHVAVPIVCAVHGMRVLGRAAAAAVWICATLVVFATVYIHVHYVADVLAGVALAALVLAGAPRLARALGAAAVRTGG